MIYDDKVLPDIYNHESESIKFTENGQNWNGRHFLCAYKTSFEDAWSYQKRFSFKSDQIKNELINKKIQWCLIPSTNSSITPAGIVSTAFAYRDRTEENQYKFIHHILQKGFCSR